MSVAALAWAHSKAPGLEARAALVLYVLANHAHRADHLAWPSRATLKARAGIRDDGSLSRSLSQLLDAELIERDTDRGSRARAVRYRLNVTATTRWVNVAAIAAVLEHDHTSTGITRLVHLTLAARADRDGVVGARAEDLQDWSGIKHRSTVSEALAKLEETGHVERQRRPGPGPTAFTLTTVFSTVPREDRETADRPTGKQGETVRRTGHITSSEPCLNHPPNPQGPAVTRAGDSASIDPASRTGNTDTPDSADVADRRYRLIEAYIAHEATNARDPIGYANSIRRRLRAEPHDTAWQMIDDGIVAGHDDPTIINRLTPPDTPTSTGPRLTDHTGAAKAAHAQLIERASRAAVAQHLADARAALAATRRTNR